MIDETHCQTPDEFLEQLAPRSVSDLTGVKRWIYRGQGDAAWQLVPSAFRPEMRFPSTLGSLTVTEYSRAMAPMVAAFRKYSGTLPDSLPFELAQRGLETDVLARFFVGVDDAGLPLPEDSQLLRERLNDLGGFAGRFGGDNPWYAPWPPRELRSILALAQHHGIPTRLLDWTHNCRVAAFFAARDSLKRSTQALAVWALDWQQLKLDNMSAGLSARTQQTETEAAPQYVVRLVTAPAASNLNLRAQRGLFTLLEAQSSDHDQPLTLVKKMAGERRPLDELDAVPVRKVTLPAAEAVGLLRLLALDGVTAAAVWPTYDGVVRSLRDSAERRG